MSAVHALHADDQAEVIHGAGDCYRYLIRGSDSNGQYFVVEGVVPPGGGPPLHVQTREEEAFYILEGEVTFYADGERIVGRTGSFVHIPRGVAHRFKNEGDAADGRRSRQLCQHRAGVRCGVPAGGLIPDDP